MTMLDNQRGLTAYRSALPVKLESEVERTGSRILRGLDRLGFSFQTKDGRVFGVTFSDIMVLGNRYACFVIDLGRLYRHKVNDLADPKVVAHLRAVTQKPVEADTRRGLMFAVQLEEPPPPKPWPAMVELPAESPEELAYAWPFGADRDGGEVWGDLLKTGHILVGGKPGGGKSTFINAGLIALLRRHSPESLRLLLIDPKSVELSGYNGLPHLVRPVVTEPEEAVEAVTWLVGEVARREALFTAAGVKNLEAYNKSPNRLPLPLLLAVIDEVTDLVIQWGGPKSAPFKELIRVASKARAFGIVLLLATQNPKSDILDTALRENSGTRVGFKVDLASHSRCILGQSGAELLPNKKPGRLVVAGLGDTKTLQGFQVSEDGIADQVARLRTSTPTILSLREAALVVFARDCLDGEFNLRNLYAKFRGVWSWRKLQNLGRDWEVRGWLTPPADAVSSRELTEELLAIVKGVGPEAVGVVTGSQGSQAVTDL